MRGSGNSSFIARTIRSMRRAFCAISRSAPGFRWPSDSIPRRRNHSAWWNFSFRKRMPRDAMFFGTTNCPARSISRGAGSWSRTPGRDTRASRAAFKDANGYWTGFAARLRVVIFNTQSGAARSGVAFASGTHPGGSVSLRHRQTALRHHANPLQRAVEGVGRRETQGVASGLARARRP